MGVGAVTGAATQPMTVKVWRWKGTASDIVRIAEAVASAADGPLLIEVNDAMGRRNFSTTAELERALTQPFRSLALQAAGSGCKVTAVFDATGAISPAAVTVLVEGADPARAAAACGLVARSVAAGAREPKGTPPAEIEKWAGIGALGTIAGPLIIVLAGEGNPELVSLGFLASIAGLVCLALYFCYESLIPRVELLAAGASPRLHKFGLWVVGAVGATVVGAVMSGLI